MQADAGRCSQPFPSCPSDRVRLLSRSLVFDLVLAVVAAAGVALADGVPREVAASALLMAIVWVPWDLLTERRTRRAQPADLGRPPGSPAPCRTPFAARPVTNQEATSSGTPS